jgi:hypothetical protein
MEDLLRALAQSSQQGTGEPASGADPMAEMLGGLLGGAQPQGGGGQVGQMLGMLEGVIGGAQPQGGGMGMGGGMNMGGGMGMGMNDPLMLLLQPVVTQLANKANISPQIAMVVVSLAIHYLLSNHPNSGKAGSLDLNSLFRQMASGRVSPDTFHNSGMVNDVMKATGLGREEAVQSLDTTFGILSGHVEGAAGGAKGGAKGGIKASGKSGKGKKRG